MKTLTQLTSLLFVFFSLTASAQITFHREYGSSNPEFYTDIQPTDDGSFIVAGARKTTSAGQWRILAGKISPSGILDWSKTYQGSADQSATSMQRTLDGNFVLAGRSTSFSKGGQDVFLMKIDADGNRLWSKTYGGPNNEWINTQVLATSDSGFIVSAYTNSYGAGSTDCYLVKTDADGDIEWTRTLGGPNPENVTQMIEVSTGGYALAGFTNSIGQGGFDALLARYNTDGDTLWTRAYGRAGHTENIYGVTETDDGGYLLAGRAYPNGSSNYQGLLIRTDSLGNRLWSRDYGGFSFDQFAHVLKADSGRFYIQGQGQTFTQGANDGFVMLVDSVGDVLWSKHYGTSENETFGGFIQLDSGDLMLAGRGHGWPDQVGIVMRMDRDGNLGCSEFNFTMPVSDYLMFESRGLTVDSGGTASNAPYSTVDHPMPIQTLCSSVCDLAVQLTTTAVSCAGDSTASINSLVSGNLSPVNYLWSNGSTSANLMNIPAGVYSVIVTDPASCVVYDTIVVSQPSALSSSMVADSLLCYDDASATATVTISGGVAPYIINWSNGDTSSTADSLSAGFASVLITDANSCTLTDSINIYTPSAISATINSDSLLCFNDSNATATISATGGTGPYAYNWSNADTSVSTDSLAAGVHYIQVTDDNGCVYMDSVDIYQPDELTANILSFDIECFGANNGLASAEVFGGTAPYSYLWSNGDTIMDASGLEPGAAMVLVEDANGCILFNTLTINEPAPLAMQLTALDVSCYGTNTGMAVADVTGGVGPYQYNWTNGSMTDSALNLSVGTYTLEVTDNNFCTLIDSIQINSPDSMTIALITNNVLCHGDNSGSVIATVAGGMGSYSYDWAGNNPAQLEAGTYDLIVTDSLGCIATSSFTIDEPDVMLLNATGSDELIGNDGSIDLTVTGATPPYTFVWDNGAGVEEDPDGLTAGTYEVLVTDANACSDSLVVTVGSQVGIVDAGITSLITHVFPNPTSGILNIQVQVESIERLEVRCYDLTGKVVAKSQFTGTTGTINLEPLSAGTYVLEVRNDRYIQATRIVVH